MSLAQRARANMIEGQLRPNKVVNAALLTAMGELPREQFVPDALRTVAYSDQPINLGEGRAMLEPMVLARMIDALEAKPHHIALHIGCTTGYGSAILSRLCATVVAVEEQPPLAYAAMANLQKVGADNVVVIANKLSEGYARQAPYDLILIEGAIQHIPATLITQLVDGGSLIALEQVKGASCMARLWHRQGEVMSVKDLFDAKAPLLPGFVKAAAFRF